MGDRTVPGAGSRAFEIADERRQVLATVKWRGPAVELHFDVAAGPVPRQTRTAVVADVFKLLNLAGDVALHISVPLGDVDLIGELRRRCGALDTRAAGSTCLIDVRRVPELGTTALHKAG